MIFKNLTMVCAAAAVTAATAISASASVIITGDPTTTTGASLQLAGSSESVALKADTVGVSFVYDLYVGRYTVSAADVVAGVNIVGNTGEGATGGNFNVGDDILVIGWKAGTQNPGGIANNESNTFLKVDPNLNGGYATAAEPGGPVTSFSQSDAGDYQISTSRNDFNSFRVDDFRYNDGVSATTYPLQGGAQGDPFTDLLENLPFRTFGVNVSPTLSTQYPLLGSQLMLLNVTDLNNLSFNSQDANAIGDSLQFYLQLGNLAGKSGVVFDGEILADAAPVNAVPEPATMALGLMGATAMLIASRRRRLA